MKMNRLIRSYFAWELERIEERILELDIELDAVNHFSPTSLNQVLKYFNNVSGELCRLERKRDRLVTKLGGIEYAN